MERSKFLTHGIWAIAVLAAFAFGIKRGGSSASAVDADEQRDASRFRIGDGGRLSALPGQQTGPNDGTAGAMRADAELGARVAVILSEQSIAELGATALKDPNPLKRRQAFNQLLEGMTLENAMLIREQIKGLPQDSSEFRDFHYAWGAIAGGDAVKNGMESRERDMAVTMAGFAGSDAGGAIAWFNEMAAAGKANGELKSGLIHGLADADPMAAANFVFELHKGGEKNSEGLLSIVTSEMLRMKGPEEASLWSQSLPEGPLRAAAMDHVANRFVAKDPAAAAAWAEQFAGQPENARVIEEVGDEWAERDPLAAVNWLETLDSGEGKAWGMTSAFGEWVRRDPRAASQYLLEMPDSPEKDSAIVGFAGRLAWEDPQSAITWAGEISDSAQREKTLVRAGQAMLRRDAEGTRKWLATSGLSPEAQKQVLNPPDYRRGRRR